jgi:repressor LexA
MYIMNELTQQQASILQYVREHQQQFGAPPTVREITAHFGFRSLNNVRQHLELIARKGYLKRSPGKARGLMLTTAVMDSSEVDSVRVPLIGTIAAGHPIMAIENIEHNVTLDRQLFGGQDLFALRVRGDSMRDAGILDGDIAVIRQQATVADGEIAAVVIENEATLKRFRREAGHVVLHAENPAFADIVVGSDREVSIAGKLAGVLRTC